MKRLRDIRNLTTLAMLATIAAGLALVLGVIFAGWTLGLGTDDRVVLVNTALVIYTCLLTAAAAVVAVLAYRAATGRPELDIEITFSFSFPNEPVFAAASDEDGVFEGRVIADFEQSWARVVMSNASTYAAKNPGVRIELEWLGGFAAMEGWESVAFTHGVGVTAIQWDGGTDSIVHGRWSRVLPSFDLAHARELVPGDSTLVVTIVADGIEPVIRRLPVRILTEVEYEVYTEQRARRLAQEWEEVGSPAA
ncbi:hypothetical protein JS756_16970 [Streptomyces actuosus]|uniref:Uncharacterized protein n=1 Tax=Streptomyces actuosus TaxID=1885 RepID=A0ABS2VRM8_STRAS|nr:hypothetical protein [Streptomyces actuosus]MBN0045767.1 hypothetical protein [Streptomyces actuosus]